MIIGIGNVGSTSLKSKIIDINNKNETNVLGEANLDKIKSRGKMLMTSARTSFLRLSSFIIPKLLVILLLMPADSL